MKRVLVIMHNYAEIPDLMKKNLDYLGYNDVNFIFYSEEKFRYKNILQKLNNLFRKVFLKDKRFKENLRMEFIENTLIQKAQNLSQHDVIIVMNTDFFSENFLQIIKTKTKKLIGNHWDGLSRTPEIYSKIVFFDQFYVFDKEDVDEEKNIFFLTNFFFDFDKNEVLAELKNDIYYLGTYVKERFSTLKKIAETFTRNQLTQKILLFTWEKRAAEGSVNFINQFVSYETNIKNVVESKALLDLKLREHNGLSFRFFEALKYEKKIITDNSDIKNYDFYKKENIFIINEDQDDQLKNFIEIPYHKIDPSIKNKYSFKTWFETLIS